MLSPFINQPGDINFWVSETDIKNSQNPYAQRLGK
jgi:hypothetical protein